MCACVCVCACLCLLLDMARRRPAPSFYISANVDRNKTKNKTKRKRDQDAYVDITYIEAVPPSLPFRPPLPYLLHTDRQREGKRQRGRAEGQAHKKRKEKQKKKTWIQTSDKPYVQRAVFSLPFLFFVFYINNVVTPFFFLFSSINICLLPTPRRAHAVGHPHRP